MIAASVDAWLFLITDDPKAGIGVPFMLGLGWMATGFFAGIFWLVSLTSGEWSSRGWYFAWVGLLLGLSGPAHLAVLLLLT